MVIQPEETPALVANLGPIHPARTGRDFVREEFDYLRALTLIPFPSLFPKSQFNPNCQCKIIRRYW